MEDADASLYHRARAYKDFYSTYFIGRRINPNVFNFSLIC